MFTAYRNYRYQMETRPGARNLLRQAVGEGRPPRQGYPDRTERGARFAPRGCGYRRNELDRRDRPDYRQRRPRPNDLTGKVAPKVVNGLVFHMTSKIYNILGSVATSGNAFKPHTIAVDTCSGYKLVRKDDLHLDWNRYVIRDAPLPLQAGANSNPLRLTAVVRLAVRLRNTTFRIPFVVAEQLAVPVLLGTAFVDAHVRSIDIGGQKLELRHGGSIAIVDGNRESTTPTRRHGRHTSRPDARDEAPQVIRIARWVTIPVMSQARVRVTTAGRGLVFLEQKPSLHHRHGVRLTNGVAEVLRNVTFDVVVANFSRRKRRLPKHTVLGYAKRNPLAILTPERKVAEGIAHALHLTDLTDQVGEAGVGRSNSDDKTTPGESEVDTDERSPIFQPTAEGTVRPQEKDPANPSMDWEKEIDLSYIDDEMLRGHVLEMLRRHLSLWSGAL